MRTRDPREALLPPITPDLLLRAYAAGVFPMAERRDDPDLFWVDPRRRGILPLDGFHVSRSLRRRILRGGYGTSVDRDFAGVLRGCADRPETWINDRIEALYLALFESGHAHSQEVWEGGALVGGVYGVVLGGAFFGESMFSRRTDASKVALAFLTARLRRGGFTLFDTQFVTPHLLSLGAEEIPRAAYQARLAAALRSRARFDPAEAEPDPAQAARPPQPVVQRRTQTS
jgi:leucyl/phenylalanyl-tRNA--protein transferase